MTTFLSTQNFRLSLFYLLLVAFASLPIWSVENFINQDGSPHLYNSYIMLELIAGNSSTAQTYALNSVLLPNLTGYWLIVGLLLLFSAATVTKLMVTFTFAGFVASVGWLRFQTVGREDLQTTLLLGAVLAFNWMWFLGFYNFIISVAGFTFTTGWYWTHRENLNFRRAIALSLLLIFVFLSHLIGFGMLALSILILSFSVPKPQLKRTLQWTLAAFIPIIPLAVVYKLLINIEGGASIPVWHHLSNPFSLSEWILQLQGADPFLLISRKTLPFLETNSIFFALLTPVLWLMAALFCLLCGSFINRKKEDFSRQHLPFVFLTLFAVLFWIFAPDDFGKSHGGFLRERVLLCGLICLVPLFSMKTSPILKRTAQICLVFIIIFQTAAVWDYALRTNQLGREYLTAKLAVENSDSLASIVRIENGCRFKSNPLVSINTLLGVGNNMRVWDNYEIGYYLFPVIAKNPTDRQFVFDFSESNAINLCNPPEVDLKLSRLDSLLKLQNEKIRVMAVWNGDERIHLILSKWYEDQPFFQNGRIALYRHR